MNRIKFFKILYSLFWAIWFSFLQTIQLNHFLENNATDSTVIYTVINTVGIAYWTSMLVTLVNQEK